MAITSFQGVRDFIDKFLTDHSIDVSGAPHADFWNTMKYDDFVNGSVPGLTDGAGLPLTVPILVKGNSQESNLIKILQGKLTVSGADRQKVGQTAAEIRKLRVPDPYKAKGIKYAKEVIRRKVGKAGGK